MTHHAYDGGAAQLQEMRDLIVRSEALAGHTPLGWQYALLENWRYADTDHPVEFFQHNAHLWRDEGGGLIGFAISNRGDHRLSLQMVPRHAASLLPIMLDWARQERAVGSAGIAINCYRHDLVRREALKQAGYSRSAAVTCTYRYDLDLGWPAIGLPEGYHIASVAEHGDIEGLIALESVVFETTVLDRRWYEAKSAAPGYAPNLHLHVIAPNGELAAFAHGWPDHRGRRGEIDPVGTHPAHRRKGLAAAVVTACFGVMRDMGIARVYVATEKEPYPANRLYESLGPAAKYYEDRWTMPGR